MKLLFDHDLSPRLVRRLADLYPNASHVALVGLDRATDLAVWTYAHIASASASPNAQKLRSECNAVVRQRQHQRCRSSCQISSPSLLNVSRISPGMNQGMGIHNAPACQAKGRLTMA